MATATDPRTCVHRRLRFSNLDELARELDRIEQAAVAGKLRCTGNWSAGQCFGHLAAWIEFGYDGYPMKPPPFFIRWYLRRKLQKYLRDGMDRGIRIPGSADGTWGTESHSTQEGAGRLRRAIARLVKREPPRFHSPGFGPMSEDDRVALVLRHSELHLGYLHPE